MNQLIKYLLIYMFIVHVVNPTDWFQNTCLKDNKANLEDITLEFIIIDYINFFQLSLKLFWRRISLNNFSLGLLQRQHSHKRVI